MKKIILLFFFLNSCASGIHKFFIRSYSIPYNKDITSIELKYIINTLSTNNYIIIDLREYKQYKEAHIINALSIQYKNIHQITNLSQYHHKFFIFYDDIEVRLSLSNALYKKFKITNFRFLLNGFKYWTYQVNGDNTNSVLQKNINNKAKDDL